MEQKPLVTRSFSARFEALHRSAWSRRNCRIKEKAEIPKKHFTEVHGAEDSAETVKAKAQGSTSQKCMEQKATGYALGSDSA